MTTPAIYGSNATAQQIAQRLRSSTCVVVTTHAKPDGDAAGSSLAIARTLIRMGKTVEVWHVGPFQNWLKAVSGETPVKRLNPDQSIEPSFEPDAIVITDTGSWVQLETVALFLRPRTEIAVVIDHHLHGDPATASLRLVQTNAAAATEAIAPVIDALLGLSPMDAFPRDIAEALYLGLATDTGWFKFSNVTPNTMRLAARLLESGVDHSALYLLMYQQDNQARPLLMGRALSSLTFEADARIAVMSLTADDLKSTGGGQEDTGGFADPVMSVATVCIVAVFTDATRAGDAVPLTKVSLRSKPGPGAVDVAAVSASLGGGGHARAAGIKLKLTLPQAREAVVNALTAALPKQQ